MYCFSTTALADEYFEGNQTFTYSLTLIGEQVPVVISPNVTMVTILDNTSKRGGGKGVRRGGVFNNELVQILNI